MMSAAWRLLIWLLGLTLIGAASGLTLQMPPILISSAGLALMILGYFVVARLTSYRKTTRGEVFIGGVRWPPNDMGITRPSQPRVTKVVGGYASWPLASLVIEEEAVIFGPNASSGPNLIPEIRVIWSDILCVQCLYRGGLRFTLRSTNSPIIFWSVFPERILDALHRHNVVVDRHPRPTYGFIR